GDRDIAEEILQEAAYLAYKNRRQYRGEAPFSSWIYRIAINAWKKHVTGKNRKKDIVGIVERLSDNEGRSPEEILSGAETGQKLWEIINSLDERYRIPFLLRHVDNLSYVEIGRICDLNENAARVRIYRARHLLRSMIEEDGF
ncbi:MAG: RNA polymerase sigma factor, partial [Proteobacteria bacterium]|nr:RNA polymerase sigma factor [Pseudomonadota bacterium]